jgi:hypothetical protein
VFRVVTRQESEFSDSDREDLLAFKQREASRLPHGQPIDEATDPRADPNYYGEGAFRYEVGYAVDQAQAAIEREKAKPKFKDVDLKQYVFWPVRKDYSGGAARIVRSESELNVSE